MDNKELTFTKSLEKARELAKEQNHMITASQVKEVFSSHQLSEEQYDLVYDYLKKHKIGVDEAVNVDDGLAAEEKEFLKEYLKMLSEQHVYDEAAKNELSLLKEIARIAKYYTGQGVSLEDLIGEGNVALAACKNRLECEHTVAQKIKEAMETFISETAHNRNADAQMVERVNDIAEEARALMEVYGRKVTVQELALEGRFSADEVIEAIQMAGDDLLDISL